jgi:hypothetical protein
MKRNEFGDGNAFLAIKEAVQMQVLSERCTGASAVVCTFSN